MCSRYHLKRPHAEILLEQLKAALSDGSPLDTRYNIAPGGPILAIRNTASPATPLAPPRTTAREALSLRWGLVPAWARDDRAPVINARAETAAEKPSFRDSLRTRRCLVPATGFFEWEARGRARQPWLFRLCDDRPFCFAGLWDTWRSPDGDELHTCVVLTTTPNEVLAPLHDRMPVILSEPGAWDAWLDPRIVAPDTLLPLLRPAPAATMTALAVHPRVNNVRHDAPDCLEPAPPEDSSPSSQLSLGF